MLLVVFICLLFVFSLVSGKLEKTIVTVLLSIFAHGLSALPGIRILAGNSPARERC